jgi:uncharacterized cofD-like protein
MQFGKLWRRWVRSLRLWLIIGIGVKRWLVMMGFGTLFLGGGLVYLLLWLYQQRIISARLFRMVALSSVPDGIRIAFLLVVGVGLLLLGVVQLGRSLVAPFRRPGEDVGNVLLRYRQRNRGPRIVTIGGGTGMPELLRGLKVHTNNITAIVTVADDGGSSGRLRRELGVLPPGDFRNNIAALARDEELMTGLMQYRFGEAVDTETPSQLKGHTLGNLLIAALTGLTGSFDEALFSMNRVLAMRGTVIPATLDDVTLVAHIRTATGVERVVGESEIPNVQGKIERVMLEPQSVRVYPPALRAILQADLIVMGPGSLYTSVLPNLLVREIVLALEQARGKRVYVCNVATQRGETDGYSLSDHVAAITRHTSPAVVQIAVAHRGGGVLVDEVENVRVISADLASTQRADRHDGAKVAALLIELLENDS